jgi:hypothetical protein
MDPRSNLYRKPASASQSRTHPSPSPSPSISTSSNSDQAVSHPNLSTSTASNSIHSSAHSRVPSPVPPNLNHNLSDPSRRWPRASKATLISPPPRYDSYQSFGPRLESPNYMNFEKQHLGANSGFSQWPLQVPDRPLIERVTNRWQSDPKYKDLYHGDYDDDDDYAQFMSEQDESLPICSWPRRMPRRALRYLFVYLTFLLCVYSFWHFWFHPAMEVDDDFDRGMSQSSRESGAFGINVRPEFADMLQVQYLDSKFVPGATHGSRKRLVVVGDVHGCKDERKLLLLLTPVVSYTYASRSPRATGENILQ